MTGRGWRQSKNVRLTTTQMHGCRQRAMGAPGALHPC